MAKVFLSRTDKLCDRLRMWIYGQMKSKGIHQKALADHLGMTQQAVSAKLTGRATITYEDFIRIVEFLNPDDKDLLWLLSM